MKGIFVSYRHSDAQGATDYLGHHLKRAFSSKLIFRDVDSIRGGDDWRVELEKKLNLCDVMLVVIGRSWIDVANDAGGRRLDDPQDVVRYEIEAALRRPTMRVIPVIVEGASLPPADLLPPSLNGLLSRQLVMVRPEPDFIADANKLISAIDRYRWLRKLHRAAIAVAACLALLLSIAYYSGWIGASKRMSGSTGTWLYDSHVQIRVPESVSGTLLSDESYELSVEFRNSTSMTLHIVKIVTEVHSPAAAELLGQPDTLMYTASDHVPRQLKPHETVSVRLPLNQILPSRLVVSVYHNQWTEPSRFEVDLKSNTLPMPAPRFLSREQIFKGFSGRSAVERAWSKARDWSADAALIAAFPATSATYIDEESRLKYLVVQSWVVSFYSPRKDRAYMTQVGVSEVEGSEVAGEDDRVRTTNVQVTLSDQEALDIANRASLLSGDWREGTRLSVLKVEGRMLPVWSLSYRGPEGLPINIDAVTGDRLQPTGGGNFRRQPLSAAATK